MQRIIKKGKWEYLEKVFKSVILVEQDWDEFYEEGYSNFKPNLNENGIVYFLHYGNFWENEFGNISSDSISIPFLSKEEAIFEAELKVKNLIWDN